MRKLLNRSHLVGGVWFVTAALTTVAGTVALAPVAMAQETPTPLYRELLRSEEGHIVPGLAQSWEVSADGLSYRFALGADVRTSSGEAIGAVRIVESFRQAMAAAESASLGQIASVTALDLQTLEITLREATPAFLQTVASGAEATDDTAKVPAPAPDAAAKEGQTTAATYTATARVEPADQLTLTVYEREKVVASLACREPDNSYGLLTLFVLLPGTAAGTEIVVSRAVSIPIELTIDSFLFERQTFEAESVWAEYDRGMRPVRLSGDFSGQETAIAAALLTAETPVQIAVDGRAIRVDLGRGDGVDEMFNRCGEIRDMATKAGRVGPPGVADQSLWDTKEGWSKPSEKSGP